MDIKEADKIAIIISDAHCVGCVRNLCEAFAKDFPHVDWWSIVAKQKPEYWTVEFLRDNADTE